MKRVPLSQGKFALVDDEDFSFLSSYKWSAMRVGERWYAIRRLYDRTGVLMHRFLMGLTRQHGRYIQVDHKNGDGLDNRRSNLRLCSNSQNHAAYRAPQKKKGGTSFRGIFLHRKKWLARIVKNGQQYNLGLFQSDRDAAAAYNAKARELFGEFAYQNKL